MKIVIETIPHEKQRYPTVGDWFYQMESSLTPEGGKSEEVLFIKVSELGDWRYNACVAVHELVEVLKCKQDGVTQEQVDKFDMDFEQCRAKGHLTKEQEATEPGDVPTAPYQNQHCFATGIERLLAAALNVKWTEYADKIESLP